MKAALLVDTASFARLTAKLHLKKNVTIMAGKNAVHETANTIFAQAQATIPRKTGALADSGKVVYQDTNTAAIAVIGYGDETVNPKTGLPTADYAVIKHEDPRNGKWLENAMLDCGDLYRNNLQSKISEALSQ